MALLTILETTTTKTTILTSTTTTMTSTTTSTEPPGTFSINLGLFPILSIILLF